MKKKDYPTFSPCDTAYVVIGVLHKAGILSDDEWKRCMKIYKAIDDDSSGKQARKFIDDYKLKDK